MRSRGFETDFPRDAVAEAAAIDEAPSTTEEPLRDMRERLWCSIDNDESRDLDQLTVAEPQAGGVVRILVAVADVAAAVPRASAIDRHAGVNTTSVYTPAIIFPMLPERLSTDLTSLADNDDRLAIVMDFAVRPDGVVAEFEVYGARVRNRAKLAYHAIDAWLTGRAPLPAAAAAVPGLDDQLRTQDRVAQALGRQRHEHGALDLDTVDVETIFDDGMLREVRADRGGHAKALIENFMIAANGVTARFLAARGVPSIRRIVRAPARWDRIVALAADAGERLPPAPDARALSEFLTRRCTADPAGFADLSHTVVKLLGPGEYVVDVPGGEAPGHFGLAVKDYTHSTAPNRRYPDLVTQRLVKASLAGQPAPYSVEALSGLAQHCTVQEDNANRVERQVRKSAAALFVESRVGERFAATVTGVTDAGTWVRVMAPPVEGKLIHDAQGLDVGDRVDVKLVHVDVDRGFIDFAKA